LDILVVDDHKLFLEGMQYLLRDLQESVSVKAISNFEDAEQCVEAVDSYDLVLLDLNLGGGDGVALLHQYVDYGCLTPVIMVSASEDLQHIQAAMDAGASGFIPKHCDGDQMLEAIRAVLEGEIFMPRDIANDLSRHKKETASLLDTLTRKQRQVLELLAQGFSNKEIADRMFISETTVKSHIMTLFQKLDVRNRTECVLVAQEKRLIQPG
jgi:DNA-binding NarL/FixJ family response regulator